MRTRDVHVVQVRPLRIGDRVRRLDGQGNGIVTRDTKPDDTKARIMWGTGTENEYDLDGLMVTIEEPDPEDA